MQPEAGKHLHDIQHAVGLLQSFTRGKSLEDYLADAILRSAVERQFIIIGEAVNALTHSDPDTVSRINAHRRMIAFRNVLVHEYGDVDDRLVWDVVVTNLPLLSEEVAELLAEAETQG